MISLKEIRIWIDDIKNIIIDLNISIQNLKRLQEDRFEHEREIKKYGFFQHHYYQLKFIMVIQLSKILGEKNNNKYVTAKGLVDRYNEKFFTFEKK